MKPMTWLLGTCIALGSFAAITLAQPASANNLHLAAADSIASVEANTLNPIVMVRGNEVRVSDIFRGPIPRGDRAIISAPEPGHRRVLSASFLTRIARAYGLNWRPLSDNISAIINRESQQITHEDILANIRWALENEGAPENAEIHLSLSSLAMNLPVDATPHVDVNQVWYSPKSNRFRATVDVTANNGKHIIFTRQVSVDGRIYETKSVPVLAAGLHIGEIVNAKDVEYKNFRANRVRDNAILDARKLIGQEVRRPIKSGVPVAGNYVQKPTMVKRGTTVVIYYALKTMNLTAKGKAMESGAQGDTIRVLNTKSNRIVMAKIAQQNQVVVDTINQLAQR